MTDLSADEAAATLEEFWDFDGYFGQLRQGVYDPAGTRAVEELLNSVKVDDERPLSRRFVSMAWYIPLFMQWQEERVAKKGGSVEQLRKDATRLCNALERVLGVP